MAVVCTVSVGDIVSDLCNFVGVTDVNTTAIDDIQCRGFVTAQMFNAADAIRSLMRTYFFDMPEIDGTLTCVLRGGSVVATINREDMVIGHEAVFETAREQGVEFPQKIHLNYACAESDYTTTKQTSERRSVDVAALTETSIESNINFEDEEAAQTVDQMHKIAWAEFEGSLKVGVSESFCKLVPSDIISVEVYDGVYKRFRVRKTNTVDGVVQVDGVIDRSSAYTPGDAVVVPTRVTPPTPVSNLPSKTTWEVMDLPALLKSHDTLHLYFAGHGQAGYAWSGASIELLVDTEWVEVGQITYPSTMGTLQATLADHAEGLDTTNTITVALSDDDIATITQNEFDVGGNAALVGDEIINFRDVTPNGDNYDLSYLTRGGLNTETTSHAIGARFVMLANVTRVQLGTDYLYDTLTFRVVTYNTLPNATDEDTIVFNGLSQTEWAPLNATVEYLGGDCLVAWEHNKRIGAPTDAVISQHFEGFRVKFIEGGTEKFFAPTQLEYITITDAVAVFLFGGSVAEFDTIEIWPQNRYTGLVNYATPVDITGDYIALEDESGAILLEDGSGAILLEI